MLLAKVSQINVYPVKSAGGISVSQGWVEKQGLAFDRRFMLALPDGQMVTARTFPQMLQISSVIVSDGLRFSMKDMPALHLRYQDFKMQEVDSTVWNDTFTAYTTTDEANDWFSRITGRHVELLFTGETSNRYRKKIGHEVSFADGYPLLLISEASLAALNERSAEHHCMSQFRTNLVVSGTEPFAEDGWKRIRIGEVEFDIVKPCERCIMTTVDPATGQPRPTKEPLRTLSQFRANESGGVFFGQNLVAKNEGIIRADDSVEVLEYQEKTIYPDRKEQRVLECVSREEIARDFVTFWLSARQGTMAEYFPGQFISVELIIDGEPQSRCYTLSSSPSRPDLVAISVKRVQDGIVSNWLIDQFHAGDVLLAKAPAGDFHLPSQLSRPLLLLSAGSGVTPMLSMVRYLADRSQLNDVVFYHQCRSVADIPCRDELQALRQQHPGLRVIFSLTQPPVDWFGLKGRFSSAHMRQIPELAQREVFICGPEGFIEQAKTLVTGAGVPEDSCHQELFAVTQERSSEPYQELMIRINDHLISGNNQKTLLEQAESQDVSIPNSCRAGLCGACRVKIDKGQVRQESSPALDALAADQGIVLACCCIPETDIEVSF
ncbi:hybrid-cluster NAD(P)-dependent oxidoreductase [Vibrio quintilis]|uniref:Stearoyl-CoA 9-desaturase electron transfer partner n=1 Tax=Vibrio quintilis TaxID=1117707 RepID=A0A1M7Z0Y3_9VIBR|nr:hybrid-cluster NAD(P)-dependent oxidoreductase [Vibrio quintilis]SHO58619.1 Stearoyl-CoA 9-desaturase electron transfer partner [Vibrio quintilis]